MRVHASGDTYLAELSDDERSALAWAVEAGRALLVEDPDTDWHQVTCWRRLAEFAGAYLSKGRLVAVTGHLTYRTWEGRDGQKRRTAEVVATEVVLLDRRP